MLKHIYLTVVGALVVGSLSLVGAPANAVTYVNVSASDVTVKGDTCAKTFIDIDGDWVDGDITVSVTDPSGSQIASDDFSNATGVLNLSLSMCRADAAGTYTVTAAVHDNNDATDVAGSDTFTLTKVKGSSKAKSKIVTKRQYRAGKKYPWLVAGKLMRNGRAYSHERVYVLAKLKGDWYKIDSAKTRRGIVAWQFKPTNTRWRFYFSGDRKTEPSVSKVFRTPRRGHGRLVQGASPQSLVHRVTGGVSMPSAPIHQLVRR